MGRTIVITKSILGALAFATRATTVAQAAEPAPAGSTELTAEQMDRVTGGIKNLTESLPLSASPIASIATVKPATVMVITAIKGGGPG